MASIYDVLRPIVITKVVSRLAAASSRLLLSFGMQPGGANERAVGGRTAQYDVFNNVRTVGTVRAPATPAGRRKRQVVGTVPFTFPRMFEQVFIDGETVHNLRKIGGPASSRDEAGEAYIRRQSKPPAQRLANFRTAMLVGMLRDSLYYQVDGDDWYPSYTSANGLVQVNFQMPAGNKNQLNMLGAGNIIDVPWSNSAANIPSHLSKINAAFEQLASSHLERVTINSNLWNHIINNDYVAAGHGIANPPFKTFDRVIGMREDGKPIVEHVGTLLTNPGIEFVITDEGLDIGSPGSETFTKHIPDECASFTPAPGPDMFEMLLGSEPVAEYDNAPWVTKMGASSWTKTCSNPTGWEMFTLDNALAVPYVPKAYAYGTVIF